VKAPDFLASAKLLDADGATVAEGTVIGMLQKLDGFGPVERAPMRLQGERFGSWDADTAMGALSIYRSMQF